MNKTKIITRRSIQTAWIRIGAWAVMTMTLITAHAQSHDGDSLYAAVHAQYKTDLERDAHDFLHDVFEKLAKNRRIFNQNNNKIFTIKGHDEWVNFFLERATSHHQLYGENSNLIKSLDEYFDHKNKGFKPAVVYDILCTELDNHVDESDPALAMHITHFLEDFYTSKECPDSMNNYLNTLLIQAYFSKQISNLGKDKQYLTDAYNYTKKILDIYDDRNYLNKNYCRMHALRTMSTFALVGDGAETIDEAKEYNRQLRELLKDKDACKDAFINNTDEQEVRMVASTFEERLIRNYYVYDNTIMDKRTADSLMHVMAKRNLANPHISFRDLLRTRLFQTHLGEANMDTTRAELLHIYELDWERTKKYKTFTSSRLVNYLIPFNTLFYFNDLASVSYREKRHTVKRLCRDILYAYQHLSDQQKNTDHVKYLHNFATYDRINKYLTPKERVRYLNEIIVSTQVTTFAHSTHVSIIATMLMEEIIKHEPRLLVGMLGCKSERDVRRHKKTFLNYIKEAAMYHDLGKNQIIPIVNNDYRPLRDREYAIIKRHPELGLPYLDISPQLAKYHDTTLGHHKWYNGKGGYPESFDNTKSPYRTLIDIITLSDCMQAATERVGRNYRGEKTFDTVMQEFRRDAGTRYNPDLVRFIDEHQELANRLRDNLNTGWLDIYYEIYQNYMK